MYMRNEFKESVGKPVLRECTRSQISEPEVRGFMFWKNVPSQPKMTDPSYAAWIDSEAMCV